METLTNMRAFLNPRRFAKTNPYQMI